MYNKKRYTKIAVQSYLLTSIPGVDRNSHLKEDKWKRIARHMHQRVYDCVHVAMLLAGNNKTRTKTQAFVIGLVTTP